MVFGWDGDGTARWRSRSAPALRRDRAVQAGVAAGCALLTLVRPAVLGPGGRLAYRSGLGALAAAGTLSALTRDPLPDAKTAAAGTFAAVGVALTVAEAGEALDERLHRALAARGVRRPRPLMALTTLALCLATVAADRPRTLRSDEEIQEEERLETESVPLPDEVRALVAALLEATDGHGALELRAQLAQARAELIVGEDEDAFYPGIGLDVPPELPLAVPGSATFPVIGRLRGPEGRSFDVSLHVQAGRLKTLSVHLGEDWAEEEVLDWMEQGRDAAELGRWPTLDGLTLLIETPRGFEPL